MDGWKDVTPDQPEKPNLEKARKLAWEAMLDFGFHEVAIADAFKAESKYRKLGAEIITALGHPQNVTYWALDDTEKEV